MDDRICYAFVLPLELPYFLIQHHAFHGLVPFETMEWGVPGQKRGKRKAKVSMKYKLYSEF